MSTLFWRFNKTVDFITFYILAIVFAALILIVSSSVFCRYVLNYSLQWAEEFSRLIFVWSIWLSGIQGTIKLRHVKLEYFFERMPESVKKVLFVMILLSINIFLVIAIVYGIHNVQINWMFRFGAFKLSHGYLYMALPVCGMLMLYFNTVNLVTFFVKKFVRREKFSYS